MAGGRRALGGVHGRGVRGRGVWQGAWHVWPPPADTRRYGQ